MHLLFNLVTLWLFALMGYENITDLIDWLETRTQRKDAVQIIAGCPQQQKQLIVYRTHIYTSYIRKDRKLEMHLSTPYY